MNTATAEPTSALPAEAPEAIASHMNIEAEKKVLEARMAKLERLSKAKKDLEALLAKHKKELDKLAQEYGYQSYNGLGGALFGGKKFADGALPSEDLFARTRRPNLTPKEKSEIVAAYTNRAEGETAKSIGKKFGVAENTIYKLLQKPKKK